MKLINVEDFTKLIEEANNSPRKRAHQCLHSNHSDKVQNIIIALLKDSYIPPHFHELQHQWESFVVLKGRVKLMIFDEKGVVVSSTELEEGNVVELKPETIHTIISLEEASILYEVKEGPYLETFAKTKVYWAPEEGTEKVSMFVNKLYSAKLGSNLSIEM